jgi:hypothetical protein
MSRRTSSQSDVENAVLWYLSFGPLRFVQLLNLCNGKAVTQFFPGIRWLPGGTTKPTLSKALKALVARGDIRKQLGAWLEVPEYQGPVELLVDVNAGRVAGLGSGTVRALMSVKAEDERKRTESAQRRGNNPQRLRPDIGARRIMRKVAGRWSDKAWRYELVAKSYR